MKFWVNFRKLDNTIRIVFVDGEEQRDIIYVTELQCTAPSRAIKDGRNYYVEYEGDLTLSNDGKEARID